MKINTINLRDGCSLEIYTDDSPESPREDDNMGTMICFHKRYNIGDNHEYKNDDFNSWDELQQQIEKDNDIACIFPLYLMDHSGLSISISPFGCPWDSGQVGFIYCTTEMAKANFGAWAELSPENMGQMAKMICNCLVAEVDIYDRYLAGDVYGFILRGPPCETCGGQGENIDSCWGFYGSDPLENGMVDNLDEKYGAELKCQALGAAI